jgi:hypothetical protein
VLDSTLWFSRNAAGIATIFPAMQIRRLFPGLLVATLLLAPAEAQTGNCTQTNVATRPDCPGALIFFRSFQSALQKNDRQTVASLISYPVLTSINRRRVHLRNQAQLLAHFDDIFDSGVRCAILNATEKDVWGNWQGFTVGGGAVWFDGIIPAGERPDTRAPDYWTRYPFKIKTINNNSQYPCKTP